MPASILTPLPTTFRLLSGYQVIYWDTWRTSLPSLKMADLKSKRRPSAGRPSITSIASIPSVTNYRRASLASRHSMPSIDRLEKLDLNKDNRIMTKKDKIIYTLINNYIHLLFVSTDQSMGKYCQTFSLLMANPFAQGLTLSSMAPAFVDYKEVLHTEMQWIGLFPMFQAIGIFSGSFSNEIPQTNHANPPGIPSAPLFQDPQETNPSQIHHLETGGKCPSSFELFRTILFD